MKFKQILCFFALLLLFILSSCLGADLDITINQNGGGTMALEYRISRSLDSLGKLDGNERWNTIPAGKADFERSLARLPGIKLLSFSSGEDEKNLNISVKAEFSDIDGLLAFMDAQGSVSSFTGGINSGSLSFILNEGQGIKNPLLNNLIESISRGYAIRMKVTFPGPGRLEIFDNKGRTLNTIPGSEINPTGKTVSCSIPLYGILSSPEGIKLVFSY